jgi:hypothetical protein
MNIRVGILGVLIGAMLLAGPAAASVVVSTGYNDDPNEDALPNPWVGAANTNVLGSPSAISNAEGFDPDTDAVLFQNTGGTAVTLSALSFAPSGYDLFSLAGQTAPVTIDAGKNLIVLGVDGSDALSGVRQTVDFTLDGTDYSALDAVTSDAFDGVLFGKVNWTSAETQPWAQIDCIGCSTTTNPVPEPSSLPVLLAGLGLIGGAFYFGRKKAKSI